MIEDVIDRWHRHLRGELPGGLDALLDDDVVFYSPIVYTPQRGKAITALYLQAAAQALPGERPTGRRTGRRPPAGGTRRSGRRPASATRRRCWPGTPPCSSSRRPIEGKYVNGVDIIRCNDAGRIVEFRVMIRPLQAVDLVHRQMGETLERMRSAA